MAGKNHVTGRMTRRSFIRRVGVGGAAVGAAALGLSRTARAALPGTQPTNPDISNIDDSVASRFEVYPTGNQMPSGKIVAFSAATYPLNAPAFMINDGMHPPVAFFIKKPNGATMPGVEIPISATATNIQVGAAIATAINGVGAPLFINANSDPGNGNVYLSYDFISDSTSDGNAVSVTDISMPPGSIFPWAPGAYSNDVRNVQWAIDHVQPGGTVVLKQYLAGTTLPKAFEFGINGTVLIRQNVLVQGEHRGERQALDPVFGYGGWILEGTRIHGGNTVIYVGNIPNRTDTFAITNFAVRDIVFDESRRSAVIVYSSQGYGEISGCKVQKIMRGAAIDGRPTGVFPIIAHGGPTEEEVMNLRGTLRIKNNFLGAAVKPDGSMDNNFNNLTHFTDNGLDLLEISGNVVEDICWSGFIISNVKGRTVVSGNKITKTRSFNEGAAISIGLLVTTNNLFKTNYAYDGNAEITGNEIIVGSPPPALGLPADQLSTTNTSGIIIASLPPNQFPDLPGYPKQMPDPPSSFLISGNRITMHKNYASEALNPAAIACLGSANNVTCTGNTVTGAALYGIRLSRSTPKPYMADPVAGASVTGNTFDHNDLKGFTGGLSQLFIDADSRANLFKNNDYGSTGAYHYDEGQGGMVFHLGLAGAYVRHGFSNTFVNENFWGNYPGTRDAQGNSLPITQVMPCMWFAGGSSGNTVSALKNGQALQGFDVCTQIYLSVGSEDNIINGYDKCGAVPQSVMTAMLTKEAEFVQKLKDRCLAAGGSWDDTALACTLPESDDWVG